MAAWGLGIDAIRASPAAQASSPLPLVFTQWGEHESFSTRFVARLTTDQGEESFELDPEFFARIEGPYMRRHLYLNAVALNPAVRDPGMWARQQQILTFGLCGEGPLAQALGVTNPVRWARIKPALPDATTQGMSIVCKP